MIAYFLNSSDWLVNIIGIRIMIVRKLPFVPFQNAVIEEKYYPYNFSGKACT
jgi:hypothetical protein